MANYRNYSKNKLLKLIDEAIKTVELAQDRISDAKASGITVSSRADLEEKKEYLYEMKAKVRESKKPYGKYRGGYEYFYGLSDTAIGHIKQIADYRRTYFDMSIKYDIEVPDPERSTATYKATKSIEISQYDINTLRRRQVLDADKLTEEQNMLLSKWSAATELSSNITTPELNTPQQERAFINKFSITRDVSFGGSSQLLNSLAYTYDALPSGREFVLWLQGIMKDPNVFVQVEKWYRMNKKIQDKIDAAIKKEWYTNFQSFSAAIVEFIDSISSSLNIDIPDEIREKYEGESESELYGAF